MCEADAKSFEEEHYNDGFIGKYGILLVYGIAILSYVFSLFPKPEEQVSRHWVILIPVAVFIVYDIWFRWFRNKGKHWVEAGRNYKETVSSIRAASTYVSFFLAFIAVAIGFLYQANLDSLKPLFQDKLIILYSFLVLVLSGVILLFVPISYRNSTSKEPSEALKNCFFAVLLMEKIVILLLVYLIIKVAMNCGI